MKENQPPEPDSNRWRRMIELHLLDELSEAEFAELNTAMQEDREVRDLYRRACHADMRLQRLSSEAAVTQPISMKPASFFARPFAAAAAGLMLGVFCTSMIWAASESGRETILTLFQDSFESGNSPIPAGGPVESDAWGGDFAEIVDSGAFSEVTPVDGKRMFRFRRADYKGKENPVGYVGDIYRVIDLHEQAAVIAVEDSIVMVEAAFGSVQFEESGRFVGSISLNAFDAVPQDGDEWRALIGTPRRMEEFALASARRRDALSSQGSWHPIRLEMRLPRGARFLLIGLHLGDQRAPREYGSTPPAVQFDGQFADDVRVTLRTEPN